MPDGERKEPATEFEGLLKEWELKAQKAVPKPSWPGQMLETWKQQGIPGGPQVLQEPQRAPPLGARLLKAAFALAPSALPLSLKDPRAQARFLAVLEPKSPEVELANEEMLHSIFFLLIF